MVSEVSILIPIYNFDITTLVHTLLDQCQRAAITFEIICLDDASNDFFKKTNQSLAFLKNVHYEELPQNISRAAIRNLLAQRAKLSYLLFLDNDSQIVTDLFILHYLQVADPYAVFVGGTVYQAHPPEKKYRLHWHYGRQREQRPAHIRQLQPRNKLQVNNLFINRNLFRANPLPEAVQTYGHEDTLWGQQLEKANIPVRHVNNPVMHAGLEPVTTFLFKTKQAVENLADLLNTTENSFHAPIYQAYTFLDKWRLVAFFGWIFKKIKPLLEYQLQSTRPSLFLFDIYKLGLFVQARQSVK